MDREFAQAVVQVGQEFPGAGPRAEVVGGTGTCSYCDLLPLGDDRALIAYSDFKWPDKTGAKRKTILVRTVADGGVTPGAFVAGGSVRAGSLVGAVRWVGRAGREGGVGDPPPSPGSVEEPPAVPSAIGRGSAPTGARTTYCGKGGTAAGGRVRDVRAIGCR